MSDTLASDAEREQVAERLRGAAGEGRLTTDELSERLGRAYASRTHGELEQVLAGLPSVPARVRPRRTPQERLTRLAVWFIPPNVICISVWAVSGAHGDFWPKWVLLATGIRLLLGARRIVLGPPAHAALPPPRRDR